MTQTVNLSVQQLGEVAEAITEARRWAVAVPPQSASEAGFHALAVIVLSNLLARLEKRRLFLRDSYRVKLGAEELIVIRCMSDFFMNENYVGLLAKSVFFDIIADTPELRLQL